MPMRNIVLFGRWKRENSTEIGITYYKNGSGINPVQIAQLVRPTVLAILDREFEGSLEGEGGKKLLKVADFLLGRSDIREEDGVSFAVWWYDFDYPIYGLQAPWLSGMAQGLIAELMLAAYYLTGDSQYLSVARLAGNTLTVKVDDGGAAIYLPEGGLWFEEYAKAGTTNPMVLNGHNFALEGLYYLCLEDKDYCIPYERGLEGLKEILPRFDVGIWTHYDLVGTPANQKYQQIHVRQLHEIYDRTGDPFFLEYSNKFRIQTFLPLSAFYRMMVYPNEMLLITFVINSAIVFLMIRFCIYLLKKWNPLSSLKPLKQKD
jgi:hypothetical protein